MKKYTVIDLEGGNFMDDTYKNPLTANQLRSRFWQIDEARTEKYQYFTLSYIAETWYVDFKEVKNV